MKTLSENWGHCKCDVCEGKKKAVKDFIKDVEKKGHFVCGKKMVYVEELKELAGDL